MEKVLSACNAFFVSLNIILLVIVLCSTIQSGNEARYRDLDTSFEISASVLLILPALAFPVISFKILMRLKSFF